jgi:hypothetical protein
LVRGRRQPDKDVPMPLVPLPHTLTSLPAARITFRKYWVTLFARLGSARSRFPCYGAILFTRPPPPSSGKYHLVSIKWVRFLKRFPRFGLRVHTLPSSRACS